MRKSLIVAVLPLVLLAACSSSDDASDTTVAATDSTPTAAPADESTIPDSTEAVTTEVSTTEVSTTEVEATVPDTTDVATSDPIMEVTDATMPDPALADAAPPDGSILMVKLPVGDDLETGLLLQPDHVADRPVLDLGERPCAQLALGMAAESLPQLLGTQQASDMVGPERRTLRGG